ncbi:glycosyl transferase family 11 [Kineothrix alysoides]|uniref:Glycosyl transferase family 11 n=1 Tax=Kineothrix alysoides TaxID=1469948 RepID=A0A4R1R296_9FIRM|nr:alpha-1,2-fucosyltransferase [Kineothrix alysoides]TCL59412.1 glycosyl transferase family 11 [Kineothrix alysoides]
MNIIRMSGGIGNQMFQYALYLKIVSLGREVKFDDVTEYELDNARPIMLPVFGIDYPRATKDEIMEITDGFLDFKSRVRRKLRGRKSMQYNEASFDYDEEVLRKDSAYLCGNFQSEKYFKDIEKEVREAFRFRNVRIPAGIEKQVKGYEKEIAEKLSISIHIRRGDYLQAADVYGGICTDAYYEKAIEYMKSKYPEAHFFVFTNDTLWAEKWCDAKQEENAGLAFTVVKGTQESTGYIDLMLMSKCRHHIIANSSFSWWGSWLGAGPGKCVVAPIKWLNTRECHDIFTPDMVRIDAYGKIDFGHRTGL